MKCLQSICNRISVAANKIRFVTKVVQKQNKDYPKLLIFLWIVNGESAIQCYTAEINQYFDVAARGNGHWFKTF